MSDILSEYYAALDRIIKKKTNIVPKGGKINNDTVALEAGRSRGSIKKSRESYGDLIIAIQRAAEEHSKNKNSLEYKLEKSKKKTAEFKHLWEETLAREMALQYEVHQLKKIINKSKGKVTNIK